MDVAIGTWSRCQFKKKRAKSRGNRSKVGLNSPGGFVSLGVFQGFSTDSWGGPLRCPETEEISDVQAV